MPREPSQQPTEVELQILRILWELGRAPVREIHQRLNAVKGTNYSTTVKMLAVMLEKVYAAALTQKRAQKRMLGDLIDKLYDGSAQALVLHALSAKKASAEELNEIRRILDQLEDESS